MTTHEEAALLIEKIDVNGGIVFAKDRRRLVELHNDLAPGSITYSHGCRSCVVKAYSRLSSWLKDNPVEGKKKPAKKTTKKKDAPKSEPKAEAKAEAKYPEGKPSKDWKVSEIKAYMKDNDIAFNKGDKEDDLLALCAAAEDAG